MRSLSALQGGSASGLMTERALLTLPLLVAAPDGELDKDGIEDVRAMVAGNPMLDRISERTVRQLIIAVQEDIRRRGTAVVFAEALEQLSGEMRETAFCFAVRMCLHVQGLTAEARALLEDMGQAMDVPLERIQQIVVVIGMLHRNEA